MSEHHATITWQRNSPDFTWQTYNRAHEWRFTAATVPASAAKEYRGDETRVNPEEALVASLSACHMLTFLAVAAKRKLSLDAYEDDAVGVLEKNAAGKLAITRVTLRPKIVWSPGVAVSAEDLAKMHHDAHEGCFVASSVKTEVTVAPRT
ncbi:MAG TPA: OsmC family protein [Gammaproteobacteria bacterium]|jgi:organic hydroperoxide reductase OsmC/OhrA|nr:OsmC family protein [Gammaproteobacteria bacterium]